MHDHLAHYFRPATAQSNMIEHTAEEICPYHGGEEAEEDASILISLSSAHSLNFFPVAPPSRLYIFSISQQANDQAFNT